MSYNVAICLQPISADDKEAWREIDGLIQTKGEPPQVFRELHDFLTAKYPCICTLSDEEVDDGVWSDGPLWNNFGHRAAVLGISHSRAEEVLPFLVKTANDLGLVVFDWAGPSIFRPKS
jgi:hypothetical protein